MKKKTRKWLLSIQWNKKMKFVLKLKQMNKKGWKIFDKGNQRLENITRLSPHEPFSNSSQL